MLVSSVPGDCILFEAAATIESLQHPEGEVSPSSNMYKHDVLVLLTLLTNSDEA